MNKVTLSDSPKIEIYNGDCMEYMRDLPDNAFDLAIVDPPYGIGASSLDYSYKNKRKYERYGCKNWDTKKPTDDFFLELKRVSKNRIIWGANYFNQLFPRRGLVYWNKKRPKGLTFDSGEIAAHSFNLGIRQFDFRYEANKTGSANISQHHKWVNRIHPTQKPIELYEYLLKEFANPGDKILDTHLGSGTHAVACYRTGYDLTGIELDAEYFEASQKLFKENTRQQVLEFA